MRVPRTKGMRREADISRMMQPQELKSLVEAGHYRPEPARVAEAMLQHRGVRDLLTDAHSMQPPSSGPAAFRPVGQSPPTPPVPRQAA